MSPQQKRPGAGTPDHTSPADEAMLTKISTGDETSGTVDAQLLDFEESQEVGTNGE